MSTTTTLTNPSPISYYFDVSNKKSSLFPVLIITTLAIGLYLNTLKNGFVYDDEFTIVNNTLINSFDNLSLLFDKTAYFNRSGEMSYRPIVTFTYFSDYAFYNLKPWGYHLTNILLHAINGALLYFFLTLFLIPYSSRFMSPPFLISILFVTHPVLTEAVNCISYREDLLAFLFYMTTLSLYLILRKPISDRRSPATVFLYLFSCLIYLLALLSKEMAVTLPLIIICYEWLYGKEKTKLRSRLFNRYSMGYIAITLFYLYLRFYLFHKPEELLGAWSPIERLLTLPWLIMSYLKLGLFPVQLSADYIINPVKSPFSLIFILPVIALVLIFTIILINPRLASLRSREVKQTVPSPLPEEGRSILFGALFFLITLMPVYNLVPIANPFAERYCYLPLVGFVISAANLVYLTANKLKIRVHLNRCWPVFFLLVSIAFSFSVVKRNPIWKDNYLLWSDTVIKMPNSYRAYNNLGNAHSDKGQFDSAIENYNMAIALKHPLLYRVYYNLGNTYFDKGQLDRAIENYNKVIALNPNFYRVYYNFGNAYAKKGQFDSAIENYYKAIALNHPNLDRVYYNLGNVYSDKGEFDNAIENYNKAIALNPNLYRVYNNLGLAYIKKGDLGTAINNFQKGCGTEDENSCKNLQKALALENR